MWRRMPANRGATRTGFFPVIPTALSKPGRFGISMPARGQASALAPRTTSSAPTQRPGARPGSAVMVLCRRLQVARPRSRRNTRAVAPGTLWRQGMCAGEMSWDAVNRQQGSPPLVASLTRSWRRNRTGPAHACAGWWTTVRRLAVRPRGSGWVRLMPGLCWSIPRSTPVGSSTSPCLARSSNGKCSPPMTLPIEKRFGFGWPCTTHGPTNVSHLVSGRLIVPH